MSLTAADSRLRQDLTEDHAMTNITHTFPSPYLRLEATADESTVVVALPSGMEKTLVTAEINPLTGGITTIVKVTQAEYDALTTPDDSTLYVIVG